VVEVLKEGCDGVAVSSGIFKGEITANVVNFLYNIANKG
jgi:thiamine monophosphate synthase